MKASRGILSLTKAVLAGTTESIDIRVPVGIYDVQLPARHFLVHHKVAEVGDVSLTTEFLLRLLNSADGIKEDDVAIFFGFNAIEMAYVIRDAETRAYISRSEGRIWLTDAGHALFKDGDKPQIFDVVKKAERIGFDLLSLAPCDRDYQSDFERALPELAIRDSELASSASTHVPESFRRFYGEISSRKEKEAADALKRSLYSVDDVVAGDRFCSTVPFVAMASTRRPSEPEPLLDAWRIGHELSDRDQVVHGIAEFMESLRRTKTTEDDNAFDVLVEIAPSYLKEYSSRTGFAALRYFKEMAGRAGELRTDRPTVGIVGAMYQPENIERIRTAIGYTNNRHIGDDSAFIWIPPSQMAWGAARSFPSLVEALTKEGTAKGEDGDPKMRSALLVGDEKPARYLTKVLPSTFIKPSNGSIPSSLEILLVPERIAAITVHAPVTPGRGFPVPLGILTFDKTLVRRAHNYISSQLPPRIVKYGSTDDFGLRDHLAWPEEVGAQEGFEPN